MTKRIIKDDNINDLVNLTTLNGENIMDILTTMGESEVNDYIWCWKERIREEIQTRMATGIITPVKVLTWCVRGIGWESVVNEVPWN